MTRIKIILSFILAVLIINLCSSVFFQYNFITAIATHENPYFILVDLDNNILYVYKENEIYKMYPVSSGAPGTPSPLGTWTINSKSDWGEGFGGTWMGFNVPWGKYGIHGTDEPWSIGNDMSKGCIRMYNDDAAELKTIIPIGTKVTIIKGPYGPFGTGFRTLKPGDIGSDVYAIQEKLKELGYYDGWVDGKYGDGMLNAVNRFQQDYNISMSKYLTKEFYDALGIELFE